MAHYNLLARADDSIELTLEAENSFLVSETGLFFTDYETGNTAVL